MIEAGLVTLMEATTAITDVTGLRIYGVQLPQKPTVPAIVITNITGEDEYSATGALDLIPVRFQIDCYAATLDASIALGNIVNALCHRLLRLARTAHHEIVRDREAGINKAFVGGLYVFEAKGLPQAAERGVGSGVCTEFDRVETCCLHLLNHVRRDHFRTEERGPRQ